MPEKKTARIIRRLDGKAPAPKKRLTDGNAPQKVVALMAGFENKVGRYELTRVDGDQAYYSFTNRLGKTADAIMSVTMWRRMQARADTTYQKTA